jgi:Ca2+-transporting ATPase
MGTAQRYLLGITIFHAGVVMAQIGNAFACRTEISSVRKLGWLSNPYLLQGVFAEILLILALIYIPFLSNLFDHTPIPGKFWVLLLPIAPILYGLEWLRKHILRLRNRNSIHN